LKTSQARVRFAPSPTGHLHIGSVRTAIFNWLYARHTGGIYSLRVEDTDIIRSKKEYLDSQLESLKWFGLLPDEPVVYQMSRVHEHIKAARELMEKGLAYPCFCEPRDSEKVVSDLEQGVGHKYPGTCRDKAYTKEDLQKPHAIRFKLPQQQKVEFVDAIRGLISVDVDQLDDFIIIRRDGTPIYNFCVVVDDIFMKITHVIRGEDHISNTPKQILLYDALAVQAPIFAHLPLILGPAGNKLSKRDATVAVEEYRAQGFMVDALFNYLVRLGWAKGDQEIFEKEEIIKDFSIEQVNKKGAIFDLKKLQWLNGVYIRNASFEKLFEAIEQMNKVAAEELKLCWSLDDLKKLFFEYQQRAVSLLDLSQDVIALANDSVSLDLTLINKWKNEKTVRLLNGFKSELYSLKEFDKDILLACANSVCEANQEKLVNLAQPLRLALTGRIQSPGVFELIIILGKENSLKRIQRLIDLL